MNTIAQDTASPGPTATSSPPDVVPVKTKLSKKRVRKFTADDRAAHRIFERGRREAFKERLIELSGQLPVLADTDPQRLSKHVVVDESIARHKLLEDRCLDALQDIRALAQERDELLAELNSWRRNSGAGSKQPRSVANVDALVEIEKDTQRRASAVRLGQTTMTTTRQSSDRNEVGPDEQENNNNNTGAASNNQSDDPAKVPRVLPTEPAQDSRAVSELDSLLANTPWHQVGRAHAAGFPDEPTMESLAMPEHDSGMQPGGNQDVMHAAAAAAASEMHDYHILSDMNSHQQDSYQTMSSMEFPTTDTGSFDASHVSLSLDYLNSTGMNQNMAFQPQSWVSWPG